MPFLVFGALLQYVFGTLMTVTAVFLILLILVQRGRGGGLTGALGGMGGQSAFGTKAGDLFTRVTMVVATVWILLSVSAIAVLNTSRASKFGTAGPATNRSGVPNITTEPKGDATGGPEATDSLNAAGKDEATVPAGTDSNAKGPESAGATEPSGDAAPVEKGPAEASDPASPPAESSK